MYTKIIITAAEQTLTLGTPSFMFGGATSWTRSATTGAWKQVATQSPHEHLHIMCVSVFLFLCGGFVLFCFFHANYKLFVKFMAAFVAFLCVLIVFWFYLYSNHLIIFWWQNFESMIANKALKSFHFVWLRLQISAGGYLFLV